MNKNRVSTLTGKVVLVFIAMIAIVGLTIGIISYRLHMSQSIEAKAVEAERIAIAAAESINGDKYAEIMDSMEKNDYWYEVKNYADKLAAHLDTYYLYFLGARYDEEVVYFAEGTVMAEPFELGDTEDAGIYHENMFITIDTGEYTKTGPYPSGEYGEMVSGFAAIFNESGAVVGVVGVDFLVDDIIAESNGFGFVLLTIIIVFTLVFAVLITYFGKRFIGIPLNKLDDAARRLSFGDMNINVNVKSNTEIGRLAESFKIMVEAIRRQITILDAMSHGDLTVHMQPRGDNDVMGFAIGRILSELNSMLLEINDSSEQVFSISGQISTGANTLAQGATEQAAAIEELSATISELRTMIQENAENAEKAMNSNNLAGECLEQSMEIMNKTLISMHGIEESSQKINHIIKVIDDIAFQTNILALNASVEAARAGEHGKGFAVVADEVRNLAIKSAAAAKETAVLITESNSNVVLGKQTVDETNESLKAVVEHSMEASELVRKVAHASAEQEKAISEFNKNVEQVSEVVQRNSAAAEESASASLEMSNQANVLEILINQFKVKK